MTYIGAVFLVQLTRDTSQTSKWGQMHLGCVHRKSAMLLLERARTQVKRT